MLFKQKQNYRVVYDGPPSKLKVKAGQQVEVIAGNNKGLRAEVLYVDGRRLRVLVRGVNLKTHFVKEKGLQKKEAFIDYSNVKPVSAAPARSRPSARSEAAYPGSMRSRAAQPGSAQEPSRKGGRAKVRLSAPPPKPLALEKSPASKQSPTTLASPESSTPSKPKGTGPQQKD